MLFMLVITRTAHSYYAEVAKRESPAASEDEKQVYRTYFQLTFWCGTLLVFCSVAWWIYAQLEKHAFEGVIVGLDITQQIMAQEGDIYLRPTQRDVGGGRIVQDYNFAIIRDKPFVDGQQFRLGFYPEPGALGDKKPEPVELVIRYSGVLKDSGRYRLKREGTSYRLTVE